MILSVILKILSVFYYSAHPFYKIVRSFSRFHHPFSRMDDTGAGTWGESAAQSGTRDSIGMARCSVAGARAEVGSWLGLAWTRVARSRARDGAPSGVLLGSVKSWLASLGDE
jgi:hypothetical protein